jgi:3-oxoacyl-[acyl-carrier protein] reductase
MTGKVLDGQVALVTGAGSGIGQATAMLMAQRGATVLVNDIDAGRVAETVAAIAAAGGRAAAVVADVADEWSIHSAVSQATASSGSIDILVNNAGISSQRLRIDDIRDEVLDRMLAVHVKGAFNCTRAVLEGMRAKRAGRIVNISSAMGTVGGRSGSHYAAAKGALLAMTRTWAREFAPWNIHVNAVAPGGVFTRATADIDNYAQEATKRVPLGRFGEAKEIASVVAFLASSEADYITGQTISPNGGEFMG